MFRSALRIRLSESARESVRFDYTAHPTRLPGKSRARSKRGSRPSLVHVHIPATRRRDGVMGRAREDGYRRDQGTAYFVRGSFRRAAVGRSAFSSTRTIFATVAVSAVTLAFSMRLSVSPRTPARRATSACERPAARDQFARQTVVGDEDSPDGQLPRPSERQYRWNRMAAPWGGTGLVTSWPAFGRAATWEASVFRV